MKTHTDKGKDVWQPRLPRQGAWACHGGDGRSLQLCTRGLARSHLLSRKICLGVLQQSTITVEAGRSHAHTPHTCMFLHQLRAHTLHALTCTHHTHGLTCVHVHMHAVSLRAYKYTAAHTYRHGVFSVWKENDQKDPRVAVIFKRKRFQNSLPGRCPRECILRSKGKEVGSVHFLGCRLLGIPCSGGRCSVLSLIHQTEKHQVSSSNN